MTQLLVLREHLQKIYQKYAHLLTPCFRFLLCFLILAALNRMIGYQPALNHHYVELILAVTGAFLPPGGIVLGAAVFVVAHVFYVSNVLAVVMGLVFLFVYFAFLKFVPGQAYTILSVPVGFVLNLAYGIPVFLGLAFTPMSVLPLAVGVMVYYLLQSIVMVMSTSTDSSINLYQAVIGQFASNEQMYAVLLVFTAVVVVVYLLRIRSWNYAFEIAIVVGTLCNIVLYLVVNALLGSNVDLIRFLLGNIVSALLVWLVQFMRLALNYAGVEHVQFEDDEYYYYVKAVPKMNVAAPKKSIKRFNVRRLTEYRMHMNIQSTKEDEDD